jgi:hypothetical protein
VETIICFETIAIRDWLKQKGFHKNKSISMTERLSKNGPTGPDGISGWKIPLSGGRRSGRPGEITARGAVIRETHVMLGKQTRPVPG